MNIFESFNTQVDDLLQNICRKVQLTQTQYNLAEKRYKTVAEWLSEETSLLRYSRLSIYPQGSLRIGTTVKPINQEEFDLDVICLLHIDHRQYEPGQILEIVANRLADDDTYKKMMSIESRCIRLNYSGDFHLDIVPACPTDLNNSEKTAIFIPDKDRKQWRYTDPKGYATWFENQKAVRMDFIEAKNIEPLPPDFDDNNKVPLQYCVQLMKRYRDVAFSNEKEDIRPKSIVVTTLAAMAYHHEKSVNNTITYILDEIITKIESARYRLIVKNPVNPSEDISEAWSKNTIAYSAFCEWIYEFKRKWQKINASSDMNVIAPLLRGMFGELADTVIKEQAKRVSEARSTSKLGVSDRTATLRIGDYSKTSSTSAIGTGMTFNTFFGD